MRVFVALFVASLILLSMWYVYGGKEVPPRSVVLSHFLLSFLGITSFRLLFRLKASRNLEDWFAGNDHESVIIIGAGEVGANLCSELLHKTRLQMRPVAFIDDDVHKVGRYVHGVLVAGKVDTLSAVAKRYAATKAIIAFPSASVSRVRIVTALAQEAGLSVDTVPSLSDIVSGRASMTQFRPLQLEDLLGRDAVDLNSESIRSMLNGKRILVTGAGGSIGSELVAQILSYAPSTVYCVDQTEIAIFNLEQRLPKAIAAGHVQTRVLDVLNDTAMQTLFADCRPEVVFHAAAHKHVNLMESHPAEALRNNFFATAQLASLATQFAVERFILISTDKAINPSSVMGASKRLAELAILAEQQTEGHATRFMAVRFGNVLGSSGSVIPIFRKQIEQGGPLTVTDPEVTRFFMTVDEAAGLVLQSATQGSGGEIFVLDMGASVKIIDVARQMIALSGLEEGTDIEIEFTGLRPGEKLYEEVQHHSELLSQTEHPRVLRFVAKELSSMDTKAVIAEFMLLSQSGSVQDLKQAMSRHVPEYIPYIGV
jgi:FlaA1/EpsC-like NDP-sugar epimerase